jgi:hypothetical protein
MTDESTRKIAIWAAEAATRAAELPLGQSREAFFAQLHRELATGARESGMDEEDADAFAQTCVDGARRILAQLLARRVSGPGGHA